jgi:hypothetical protein
MPICARGSGLAVRHGQFQEESEMKESRLMTALLASATMMVLAGCSMFDRPDNAPAARAGSSPPPAYGQQTPQQSAMPQQANMAQPQSTMQQPSYGQPPAAGTSGSSPPAYSGGPTTGGGSSGMSGYNPSNGAMSGSSSVAGGGAASGSSGMSSPSQTGTSTPPMSGTSMGSGSAGGANPSYAQQPMSTMPQQRPTNLQQPQSTMPQQSGMRQPPSAMPPQQQSAMAPPMQNQMQNQMQSQGGLVNVNLNDIRLDIARNLRVDASKVPVNIQLPVSAAANVCGVDVNALASQKQQGGTQPNCNATNSQIASQYVQNSIQ